MSGYDGILQLIILAILKGKSESKSMIQYIQHKLIKLGELASVQKSTV